VKVHERAAEEPSAEDPIELGNRRDDATLTDESARAERARDG
jgi:hypothetical protein